MNGRNYKCVIIGVSAGGLEALISILSKLPAHFPLPIAIVQHNKSDSGDLLADILNQQTQLTVRTAEEKEFGYKIIYHDPDQLTIKFEIGRKKRR